jgi:hypothetical protein
MQGIAPLLQEKQTVSNLKRYWQRQTALGKMKYSYVLTPSAGGNPVQLSKELRRR